MWNMVHLEQFAKARYDIITPVRNSFLYQYHASLGTVCESQIRYHNCVPHHKPRSGVPLNPRTLEARIKQFIIQGRVWTNWRLANTSSKYKDAWLGMIRNVPHLIDDVDEIDDIIGWCGWNWWYNEWLILMMTLIWMIFGWYLGWNWWYN